MNRTFSPVGGTEKRLTVSGVYSDITNGGRTAQAIFETESGDILSVGIPITFRAGANAEAIKVFPYILIGVGIGAVIHHWIPESWIEMVLGGIVS